MQTPIPYHNASLNISYFHYEKRNGTGYRRRLKSDQIPLSAQIFAIVDVWDALRNYRLYRHAWAAEVARTQICSLSGIHFDPASGGCF